MQESQLSKKWRRILLLLNCLLLSVGRCGGPLIERIYFARGGKRIWFSSSLETCGWPVIFIPLISYFFRRKTGGPTTKLILMKCRVFVASVIIGVLTGLDDYLYAYGVALLPVSTCNLIVSTQTAFTAVFAFLMVNQKFTAHSINAVVLLTVGSGVLALNVSGDRPKGESNKMYVLGFMLTLGDSILYGAVLPMVELMCLKGKQAITFTLVLEIQLVICAFATAFCTFGMLVNGDFKVILRQAREYELGEIKYYTIVAWNAILWQCYFLGVIRVVSCVSSLFSGILLATLLPVVEFLAVVFFGERFQAEKGVALALSFWGFVSYFYCEVKKSKKAKIQSQEQIGVAEREFVS